MTRRVRWPIVVVVSGGALALLVVTDTGGAPRVIAAFWFLLVASGLSIAPLLPTGSPGAFALMTIATSLTLDTLVTTALLAAGRFSASAGLAALLVIAALGCAVQLAGWARHARTTEIRLHA